MRVAFAVERNQNRKCLIMNYKSICVFFSHSPPPSDFEAKIKLYSIVKLLSQTESHLERVPNNANNNSIC